MKDEDESLSPEGPKFSWIAEALNKKIEFLTSYFTQIPKFHFNIWD